MVPQATISGRAPNSSPLQPRGFREKKQLVRDASLSWKPDYLSSKQRIYPKRDRGCENRRFGFLGSWLGVIGLLWTVLSLSSPKITVLFSKSYSQTHIPQYHTGKLVILYNPLAIHYFQSTLFSCPLSCQIPTP